MRNRKFHFTKYVSTLLIGLSFLVGATGCASSRRTNDTVRITRLEQKLRKAQSEIETLREKNWVLKRRIKVLRENEGEDPQTSEKLAAFKSGVQLEAPATLPRPSRAGRQDVSLRPMETHVERAKVLPQKQMAKSASKPIIGEQADRVLARTVDDLLRAGNAPEAERTALLLEKSYPDSSLIAETRFQLGLYYFRHGSLPDADRSFQATLKASNAHVRARAGAALMRGVIARHAADRVSNPQVARANLELSRQSFEYVRKQYPGSPEAKRADRELRAVASMAARVK